MEFMYIYTYTTNRRRKLLMDTVRISLVRHHHLLKVDIVWLCCGTVNMVCCDVPILVLFSSCVKHIFGRTRSIV